MKPKEKNMHPPKLNKEELKNSLSKLLKSFKPYLAHTIICLVTTTISVVLAIIAPTYLYKLADTIVEGAYTQSIDLKAIASLGITLMVFYGSNAILSFIGSFLMNIATQKYSRDLRKEISSKINRMKLAYFDAHHYGDTLSIVTNDVDQIGQSLNQSVSTLIKSILQIIGVMIAMFITNYIMALVVFASLPLIIIGLSLITKFVMPLFKKRSSQLGKVNGIVEENYTGALVISAFSAQESKGKEFDEANQTLRRTMYKAQFFGGLMQPMGSLVSYLAYAAVCLVGGLLLANGNKITFGTISAFLVYVNLFQSPLSDLGMSVNTLQMAGASASRVFNFLEEEELEKEDKEKPHFDVSKVKGEVIFDHVKFGYEEGKTIIKDFSAKILPGMKVAIVGPTGAGKTTIVNLLMRFYETNGGDIKIDGVSIKDMHREDLRNIFGMVLQDTWIFNGSLKENIVFSTNNVSDEKLNEIIKEASLSHYVNGLPNGLETILNEDASLSSGQKQLITIARAMAENAPLLILDEATSNVDTRTEILIQEAMDKLTNGRTSFVIAHRLSTIKNADLILVLNEGNIIEQGTHEELLAKDGFYAKLYNSQFDVEENESN